MPERNSALATSHPYHQPCKIEGNSMRMKLTVVAGLQYQEHKPCPPVTMITFIEHLLRPGRAVRSSRT
jgi:hypothetical protein